MTRASSKRAIGLQLLRAVRGTEPREEAAPAADAVQPAGPAEVLAALRKVLQLTRHAVDRTRLTDGECKALRQAWRVAERS